MKPSNDREAISLILGGIAKNGVKIVEVMQDTWCPDDLTPANDYEHATDLVCEVDEAYVYVILPNGLPGWLRFVLGNDPEEVLNNHTVNLSEFVDPITDPWWA
jgi:hypothetical protein